MTVFLRAAHTELWRARMHRLQRSEASRRGNSHFLISGGGRKGGKSECWDTIAARQRREDRAGAQRVLRGTRGLAQLVPDKSARICMEMGRLERVIFTPGQP